MMLDRRMFLAGTLGLPLASCQGSIPGIRPNGPLDAHVHLFGDGRSGSGCYLSETQKKHRNYQFFLRLLDLPDDERMDETYVARLLDQLDRSPIDKILLLAQDALYDDTGQRNLADTNFYTPNEYLFDVCARAPDRLYACASINPRRGDALDEANKCAARGARAVKVHAPIMNVDPSLPEFVPFWRRLAELGMVLVVHTGSEHASAVTSIEFGDPARLEPALQEGCTVVAAHAGFGSFLDGRDWFPSLQKLVLRYDKLYCDTAVLGSMFRWRNLPRLLDDPAVLERTIHGSDWPFPSNAAVNWNRLASDALTTLGEQQNLLTRDLDLKRALGVPDACLTRGLAVFGIA